MDFAEKLKRAKLPERTVTLCLNGDLQAEFEQADAVLSGLVENPPDSLDTGTDAARERVEFITEQMREASQVFRFRALPPPDWDALLAEHPPRQGEDGEPVKDDAVGVNTATFYDAVIRTCCVDPVPTDEQWRYLLGDNPARAEELKAEGKPVEKGVLSSRQFGQLADAAWRVNRSAVDVPFSRAVSVLKSSTEQR